MFENDPQARIPPQTRPPLRGAIVAMTHDRVIGADGKMPWYYSEDLKRFKRVTMGCVVIMGRKTWDSINRKELPGRRNIVISRSEVPGAEHYSSIERAMAVCEDRDVWFIGGAQIYCIAMEMGLVNLLDITQVPVKIEHEDVVRFPEIDLSCWNTVEKKTLPGDKSLSYAIYRRERAGQVSAVQSDTQSLGALEIASLRPGTQSSYAKPREGCFMRKANALPPE